MANDNVMTTEDTLLAYSEWLDSQGLVASDQGEGADTRSHEVLAKQFVSEWEADDNKAVLAGRVGARIASMVRKAGEEIAAALAPKS